MESDEKTKMEAIRESAFSKLHPYIYSKHTFEWSKRLHDWIRLTTDPNFSRYEDICHKAEFAPKAEEKKA